MASSGRRPFSFSTGSPLGRAGEHGGTRARDDFTIREDNPFDAPVTPSSYYSDTTESAERTTDDDDDEFEIEEGENEAPEDADADIADIADDAEGAENDEEAHEGEEAPFDASAIGLKEISNLAGFTVSSYKPGCGVKELRDDDVNQFWQCVAQAPRDSQ